MQQLSRQPSNGDLSGPSLNSSNARNRSLMDDLLQKSRCLRQSMMRGASSIGLDFVCEEDQSKQPQPLEQVAWNLNDVQELWSAIIENVGIEHNEHIECKQIQSDRRSYSKVNEQYVLGCFHTVKSLTETLNTLFKSVLEGGVSFDMQQSMRKTTELILSLSTTLKKYRSINPDFNQAKQFYHLSQISIGDHLTNPDQSNVSKNSTTATPTEQSVPFESRLKSNNILGHQIQCNLKTIMAKDIDSNEQQCNDLRDQIRRLEQILQQNNQQFSEQVQKYNAILYEQQEELRSCSRKFLQFEMRIRELGDVNVRLGEEKHRDEMLIEYILKIFRNMSKKLRMYEKDAVFISPRLSHNDLKAAATRSRLMSPSPQTGRNSYTKQVSRGYFS